MIEEHQPGSGHESAQNAAQGDLAVAKPEFPVKVLYDGQYKTFEVRAEEKVKKLLDQAIAAFGAGPNPHTLALFKDGKELNDNDTIKVAGIEPNDKLLLRPSTVKGGA